MDSTIARFLVVFWFLGENAVFVYRKTRVTIKDFLWVLSSDLFALGAFLFFVGADIAMILVVLAYLDSTLFAVLFVIRATYLGANAGFVFPHEAPASMGVLFAERQPTNRAIVRASRAKILVAIFAPFEFVFVVE